MLIPTEPKVSSKTFGRWQYCIDTVEKEHYYYHVDCDCSAGENGRCILCGAPCPLLWPEINSGNPNATL